MNKGKIIMLDSLEGGGKGVHLKLLSEYLHLKRIEHVTTYEPGGTSEADKIRDFLLNKSNNINPFTELLQFISARSEVYDKVVKPAIENGISVLSDRGGFTSEAYQGYGRGMDLEFIRDLNEKSTLGLEPDLFFYIDVEPEVGLEKESVKNRMSLQDLTFYEKARKGFLKIVERNPKRHIKIPYIKDGVGEMQAMMRKKIDELYGFNQ